MVQGLGITAALKLTLAPEGGVNARRIVSGKEV